jgi:uncharacterized small protein (DUF1192 family)
MDDTELDPLTKRPKLKDLDVMSINALTEYIAGLRAEIERAEAAIESKQSHRAAADSIFKS